jgi:opacity protein-like surface antigen
MFGVVSQAVLAADIPGRSPPPPPEAPIAFSPSGWAGFYAGVHAGYSSAPKSSLRTTATATQSRDPGIAECRDAVGALASGTNPQDCEARLEPNTYDWTPSAPRPYSWSPASPYRYTWAPGSAYPYQWTPGAPNSYIYTPASRGFCNTAFSAPVEDRFDNNARRDDRRSDDRRDRRRDGREDCREIGGVWTPPTRGYCTALSGPNANTRYFTNDAGNCSSLVGNAPNQCVATAGPNVGSLLSANNENECRSLVGASPTVCIAESGPNLGVTYAALNEEQCATLVGSSPSVCMSTGGPNQGNVYTASNQQECQSAVGVSPSVCVATSGANVGAFYVSDSENACRVAVGTRSVPTGNTWTKAPDLFYSSAAAALVRSLGEQRQFIGGTLGYNYQYGRYVFGLEGDFSWMRNNVRQLESYSDVHLDNMPEGVRGGLPFYTDFAAWAQGKFGVNNFATLRLRLGYDFNDRLLVFVTGGLAGGDVSLSGRVAYSGAWGVGPGEGATQRTFGRTDNFDNSGWKWGYALGAGMNYKVTDRFVVGLTYLYVDLGSHFASSVYEHSDALTLMNIHSVSGSNGYTTQVRGSMDAKLDASFHTVRLSAMYRFSSGVTGFGGYSVLP